mmetsp:Transcript_11118/g.33266  ORF Transcript_11118/g.33266 Transcript_11118/m.33266 type:complete len:567 (-) Transcript_11118:1702-3402(-)
MRCSAAAAVLAVVLGAPAVQGDTLDAKVWYTQIPGKFAYPEADASSLATKTNSAIVFTGGGVRSYTCTLGYLAGLRDAGLLDKPRYIGGVSGGSWAVAAYVYAQLGSPGVAANDEELLCSVADPANLTMDGLNTIPDGCARKSGTVSLTETLVEEYFEHGVAAGELWSRTISKIYLESQGISDTAYFTQSKATLSDITAANPELGSETWVLPVDSRPFMVVGTTMVGPDLLLSDANHSWIQQEGTPLYFGMPDLMNITYELSHVDPFTPKTLTLPVGGFIEPYAVGSTPVGPAEQVPSGGTIKTTPGPNPFYLRELIGMSSFVAGGVTSSVLPASVASGLSPKFANFPRDGTTTDDHVMVYADGGLKENMPLIPMIRRRVAKVVGFINAETALAPSSVWNPATDPVSSEVVDDYLAGYFGIVSPGEFGYDTTRDQVFDKADFAPTVAALQAAMATGKGAIATTPLTTIENTWWGVPAGIKVTVTWVYLTRMTAWEAELPADIQANVVPKKNPSDPSSLPTSGPFENFPHYTDVAQSSLTAPQANLLADMMGWTIGANLDVFKDALS